MNRRKFISTSILAGAVFAANPVNAHLFCKPIPKPKPKPKIDPASQMVINKFLAEMKTGGVYDFVLMWRYREDDPYFFGEPEDVMSGAIGDEEVTE